MAISARGASTCRSGHQGGFGRQLAGWGIPRAAAQLICYTAVLVARGGAYSPGLRPVAILRVSLSRDCCSRIHSTQNWPLEVARAVSRLSDGIESEAAMPSGRRTARIRRSVRPEAPTNQVELRKGVQPLEGHADRGFSRGTAGEGSATPPRLRGSCTRFSCFGVTSFKETSRICART